MPDDLNDVIEAAAKGGAEGFAKGIVEKIPPLYDDLLKPGTQALGLGIGAAIKIALSPLTLTVWGFEKIADWLIPELEERLKNTSEEDLMPARASIVGPALETMKFLSEEKELRELYANLIANSILKNKSTLVHPGFVEILKNLSPDDAILFNEVYCNKFFICRNIKIKMFNVNASIAVVHAVENKYSMSLLTVESGIENLIRLGLIEFGETMGAYPGHPKPEWPDLFKTIISDLYKDDVDIVEAALYYYKVTYLGERFAACCID